jgi:hypothetical protein
MWDQTKRHDVVVSPAAYSGGSRIESLPGMVFLSTATQMMELHPKLGHDKDSLFSIQNVSKDLMKRY